MISFFALNDIRFYSIRSYTRTIHAEFKTLFHLLPVRMFYFFETHARAFRSPIVLQLPPLQMNFLLHRVCIKVSYFPFTVDQFSCLCWVILHWFLFLFGKSVLFSWTFIAKSISLSLDIFSSCLLVKMLLLAIININLFKISFA